MFSLNLAPLLTSLGQITAPFVIFLALISSNQSMSSRIAEGQHPRLFFTVDEMSALQAKATSSHAEIWAPIQNFATQKLGTLPPLEAPIAASVDVYRNYGNELISLSFGCVITQANDICMLAKQYLLRHAAWSQWDANSERDLGLAHMVMGNAIAYDWLYRWLSTSEQDFVRQRLGYFTQQLYEASSATTYNDSWKNWWRQSYVQNFFSTCNSALGMAGFALLGEDPRAEQWIAQAKTQIEKTTTLLKGINDGTWHEGMDYQSYTLTMLLPFLINLERIEGQKLLPDNYLQNYTYWRIYNDLPGQLYPALAFGDIDQSWDNAYQPQNILRFIASRYRNQYAEWMAQELIRKVGRSADEWSTPWYVFEYLYYDPSVGSQSPEWLPPSRTFWDQDALIWRSSWDANALVFGLKSGVPGGKFAYNSFVNHLEPWASLCTDRICQLNTGHDHLDASGFYLYKSGYWLAPESSANGNQATSYHNTILIDGKGQHEPPGASFWTDPNAIADSAGFIQNISDVPDYDYVISNTTGRYKNIGGIQEMTRHVLYVRPDYLLMLDDIKANSAHQYEWVSHFGNSVEVEGNWLRGQSADDQLLGVAVVSPQNFTSTVGNDGQPYIRIRPLVDTNHARLINLLYPTENAQWLSKPTVTLLENQSDWSVVGVQHENGSAQHDEIILNGLGTNGFTVGTKYGFDGLVAVIAKDDQQRLQRVYVTGGSKLTDKQSGIDLVAGLTPDQSLEVVYYDTSIALFGSPGNSASIYAPTAQSVKFNSSTIAFTRQGDSILVCLGNCLQ